MFSPYIPKDPSSSYTVIESHHTGNADASKSMGYQRGAHVGSIGKSQLRRDELVLWIRCCLATLPLSTPISILPLRKCPIVGSCEIL